MSFELAISLLLMFSAMCYLALGLRLVLAKREVGTMPIGTLFLVISVWVLGGSIELLTDSFIVFSTGRTMHFVGTALLPVAAYFSFREYTGRATSIHRLTMLLIIPLVSITLAATNYYHEFMWYLPSTNDAGQFLTRPEKWGPWFLFIHAPYSYIVINLAILTLITHSTAVARAHRRGLFLLVAACIGPLTATLAYDFGFGPDTISYVPIVFTLMLPIYTWLVLGEQIVEFTPLAYETVFQNMQDPVVVIDEQGRIIGLNHGAETLLDVTETAAMLEPLRHFFGEESPEVFEALESGEPTKMMTNTGRFLHIQASPMSADRTSFRDGTVLMFRDVSDVERAQAEVRASEKLLRTLIDHSVNGILRLRWVEEEGDDFRKLRCIFANAMAGDFLNSDREDLVDCTGAQIVRIATNGMESNESHEIIELFNRATEGGESIDIEVNHHSGGASKWLRMICEPFGSDVALTFVDITDGKAKERHMESMALSDPLTGVLNRRGFERDASMRLTESADEATGALLFIDLNDFKVINDSHGHEIGDQLLIIAAKRLRKSLRSCDIIGRPGGDEFVALVPDVAPEIADTLANRLATALEEAYVIGEHKLHCAASIGLALYPKNANTLTGLMREADQAMYRAKARCRNVSNVSSADLLEKAL
ncbi:MAG: diguanylate cyclase [Woeseiaceae bacterium]|nr:diguanylate cyclase [Woeseiaceae bacterium]NIP21855.1 diguanylate cyclase [Woeseiaceae bacterium]NIS90940.1 diguanylate cyclase [Woeseiaceae bacterium]